MTALLARALLSGLIIALASTVARRQPVLGALIVSLPLVSIIAMIWLWRDVPDSENMARHIQSSFWYILPTMPMFLLMPWMLRRGVDFWPTLAAGCGLTFALYGATLLMLSKFGIGS